MRRSPGTGSVEQRVWPSGRVTWRARWYDASGNRQRASFDTRREAETFLADRLAEVRQGGLGTMEGRRTTLAQWWEEWQLGRQVSLLTRRRDVTTWECWIEPHLGSIKLSDLRRSTVQAWVAGQARSGVAPRTVTRHLAVLRACLSAAVTEGLIASNPAASVQLPRAPKAEQRFLSIDEVRRLCQAVEPRYASMIAVGVACGLRIGELCELRVSDLDLLRRTVTVRRTAVHDTGLVGPVKSRSGEGRVVPLPSALADQLKQELTLRHPNAPVWPTPRGRPWKPGNWRRDVWRPAVEKASITPVPTPHSMRHTAVAAWLHAGASLYEASRWAGHASSSTTEQIYGHLLAPDGTVSEAVSKMFFATEPVPIRNLESQRDGARQQ
jgi:integrase